MQSLQEGLSSPEAKFRIRKWVDEVFDVLRPLGESIEIVRNAESAATLIREEAPANMDRLLDGVEAVVDRHRARLVESVFQLSKDLSALERQAEDEPREYTVDETADMFVKHLMGLADYWANSVEREKGESQKAWRQRTHEGLIHSVLATIDGNSVDLPGFRLIPMGTEEDRSYLIGEGENYFPVPSEEFSREASLLDIAGDLHYRLNKWRKTYTDKGET